MTPINGKKVYHVQLLNTVNGLKGVTQSQGVYSFTALCKRLLELSEHTYWWETINVMERETKEIIFTVERELTDREKKEITIAELVAKRFPA